MAKMLEGILKIKMSHKCYLRLIFRLQVNILILIMNLNKIVLISSKKFTSSYFQQVCIHFIQFSYLTQIQKYLYQHMQPEKPIKKDGKPHQNQTIKIVDGRYHIKNKCLGEGSFAKTYLAIDQTIGEEIACKMISKKDLIDKINASKNKTLTKEYFITALKNQVSTWKSIKHQNIVDFKDFSQTGNNIYFFLQFCSGGNLDSLLRKGHIKQIQAIPMLFQMSKGLQYLYNKSILHRDIKTENILISKQGTVKISDFGFAKMIIDEQMKDNPTDGTSVGTPIYMSPQVLLGQPYTIKCDVWSLGIVFYKLLYNMIPWEKTDHLHILIQRMKKDISFPPHIPVSEWLKQLMKCMLTIQESNRISIKQVVETIRKNSPDLMETE